MSIIKWIIDSCPCILLFEDSTITFSRREARCNEHRLLDGQALLDGVIAHNKSFNDQYSVPPTPTREEEKAEGLRITTLKIAEKERILRDGPTET